LIEAGIARETRREPGRVEESEEEIHAQTEERPPAPPERTAAVVEILRFVA
jgi:hypothetical protein